MGDSPEPHAAAPLAPPTAMALRHNGVVFPDRIEEDTFQLTHMYTQERKVLPRGLWELVEDEEQGRYAVISMSPGDDGFKLVEDLLKFEAFSSDDGSIVIGWGNGDASQLVPLDLWRMKYDTADISLRSSKSSS